MKFATIICLFILNAHIVSADQDLSVNQSTRNRWICYARGKQSFGGPIGDIWQTVIGVGSTQLEATDRAQQNCFSSGLQMCMVTTCFKS